MAVGVDDVEQAQHVRVLHLLEQTDFADGRGGNAFVFGLEADLLHRDDAVVGCAEVARLVYDTIRALADLFHLLAVEGLVLCPA